MTSTVLIVGASKGIGLEMARLLQGQGHTVYGTSRNPANSSVKDVRLLPLDVADEQSIAAAVQTILDEMGRIDVLINNAGYDLYGAAEDTSMQELDAQIDTNFYGAVRTIQRVLPIMQRQGTGKIINISSLGGMLALPFNSAYAASKYALEGYSESLRYELLPFNVFVSLVEPGQIRTDTLDTSIISVKRSGHYPADAIAERARVLGRAADLRPEHVARVVGKVVAAQRPRLRYAVGSQVPMVIWMRRMLPEALFERFIMQQFVRPVGAAQLVRNQHTAETAI